MQHPALGGGPGQCAAGPLGLRPQTVAVHTCMMTRVRKVALGTQQHVVNTLKGGDHNMFGQAKR